MAQPKPLTDEDGEVRELTKEDFKSALRFDQLPKEMQDTLRAVTRRRGPQRAPTKEQVTLRLSREVLEHYRAGGRGWQTRIDQALGNLVKRAPKPAMAHTAMKATGRNPASGARTGAFSRSAAKKKASKR